MAACGGIRRERWHPLDSELLLGVATARATHANILIAASPAGGRDHVDGCRRIRIRTLPGRYRACRPEEEHTELEADDPGEHKELEAIYAARGLDPPLAKQVAQQLMAFDALGAHARDELGISKIVNARPVQAALASAAASLWGLRCLFWSRQ